MEELERRPVPLSTNSYCLCAADPALARGTIFAAEKPRFVGIFSQKPVCGKSWLVSLIPYPSHRKSGVYLLLNQHCVALICKSRATKTFPRSTFNPNPPKWARKRKTSKSWWLSSKASTCNAEDVGSILGSGRSPGKGNGNPLPYSWKSHGQRNPWAIVHGVAASWIQLTGRSNLTAASASPSGHLHPDFKSEQPIKTQAPQPC